ncbi:polysialoglycoprotein-like isoform X3 [Oncorhynchus kisutch]|uniref:polysialoglycoprotein-like isoform X3 n=1 Tax=Oncorhynchus kisutch TaxID=8019 RepID=UPI0012DD31FC|nr:polysialoglycoprotein-like isoform X3 [Oncorhynchus kisutch]
MGRHYLLITQTIFMIMGGVRELLLVVMTVGVVKVSCYPVGKSQKQDQVSLQRRLGELSSNDVSIVHALALLRSIGSDAKQTREEYLETNEVESQASPNHGSSPANDALSSEEKLRHMSSDDATSEAATGPSSDDATSEAATGPSSDDATSEAATGPSSDDATSEAATGPVLCSCHRPVLWRRRHL